MSDMLLVSTRKGLFTVRREKKQWAISAVDFMGDNVSICIGWRRPARRDLVRNAPRWPFSLD